MNSKFGRNYSLAVEATDGDTILIEPPFTIEFDITRSYYSSAYFSTIRIYNLSEKNRSKIRKDSYAWDIHRTVELRAGYGEKNLPLVLLGDITSAWSVREGTNFITTIESNDAGFSYTNGISNLTVPQGAQQVTVLTSLIGDLAKFGVTLGTVGSFPGTLKRGNSYNGNTTAILRELTGGNFFIDNGKANCLGNDECLPGEVRVITSDSGLLNTPLRENDVIHLEMLFEPRIVVGQLIKLDSSTAANFNGFYKVCDIKHRGMISESVCGDAVTTLGLIAGEALNVVTV